MKFALKMKDGVRVRTLQELRDNFDLDHITEYFLDGKLETWLEDRYYDEELEQIRKLNKKDPELQKKLCQIFGVEYAAGSLTIDEIEVRNRKLARLKEITDDEEILAHADSVAFSQEELVDLLDEGVDTIYLCGSEFTIPEQKPNKVYIGINTKMVITSVMEENFKKNNIRLFNIKLEKQEDYEKNDIQTSDEKKQQNTLKFNNRPERKDVLSQIRGYLIPCERQCYCVSMKNDFAIKVRIAKENVASSHDGAVGQGELFNIYTEGKNYFEIDYSDNFSNQIIADFRNNIRLTIQELNVYLDGLDKNLKEDNRKVLEKIKEICAVWKLVANVKKISREELENPYYKLKPFIEYQKHFWTDMEGTFDELKGDIDDNTKMYSEVMTKKIRDAVLVPALKEIETLF